MSETPLSEEREQLVRTAVDIARTTGLTVQEALENVRAVAGYVTQDEANARAGRAVEQERARVRMTTRLAGGRCPGVAT